MLRWLALLLAAATPTGAAWGQQDEAAGPFGDERQFFYRCEAEVEQGALSASGTLVVDHGGSRTESVVWLSTEPLMFDDYVQASPANLHAYWSGPSGPQAFEAGRLHLSWDSPQRLKRPVVLTVDGSLHDGAFAIGMNRFRARAAAASIRLAPLLRWAGEREELRFNIYDDAGGDYRGTAVFPMAIIHRMRGQFDAVLAQLDAKADDFQNRCTRHEYRDDEILVN